MLYVKNIQRIPLFHDLYVISDLSDGYIMYISPAVINYVKYSI